MRRREDEDQQWDLRSDTVVGCRKDGSRPRPVVEKREKCLPVKAEHSIVTGKLEIQQWLPCSTREIHVHRTDEPQRYEQDSEPRNHEDAPGGMTNAMCNSRVVAR